MLFLLSLFMSIYVLQKKVTFSELRSFQKEREENRKKRKEKNQDVLNS